MAEINMSELCSCLTTTRQGSIRVYHILLRGQCRIVTMDELVFFFSFFCSYFLERIIYSVFLDVCVFGPNC